MRLNNTTTYEDKTLVECTNFGGVAAGAVAIAERLDSIIEAKENELESMKDQISEMQAQIDSLQEQIEALEGGDHE